MVEALIILRPFITGANRDAVARLARPTQSISDRAFIATLDETDLERLRAVDGVAAALTGAAPEGSLPALDEAESLFVGAWLSSHARIKERRGEGLDWDTPPMLPPDHKP